MAVCGLVSLLVGAFFIRDVFPLVFCVLVGLGMLATARFLDRDLNDLILRVIGLSSMIYVPYDIFDDTIARSGLRSDAYMLAKKFGGPTIFWGGLWLVLSFAVIALCARYGIGQSSNIRFGRAILK